MRNSEPLVISAKPGEAVTLTCTFEGNHSEKNRIWYKQRLEHTPLEVGSKLKDKNPIMSPYFKQTRFKIDNIAGGISLRIESVTKEDEGLYFCWVDGQKAMEFSNATLLAVKGDIVDLLPSVFFSCSMSFIISHKNALRIFKINHMKPVLNSLLTLIVV